MSELVKRVEAALREAMASGETNPEVLAVAVIVAVRAPTKHMLDAACAAMSPGKRPTNRWISERAKHGVRYRAMIDAELPDFTTGAAA